MIAELSSGTNNYNIKHFSLVAYYTVMPGKCNVYFSAQLYCYCFVLHYSLFKASVV